MRILHLLSQNHLTGAEVYAVQLIQHQVQNGHLVWQISNGFFTPSRAATVRLDVETRSLRNFLKSVLSLREFLIENRIQVIHCHSRAAAKMCYYARLFLRVPDGFGGFHRVAQVSTIHGRQHVSASKKLHNQYGEFLIPVCENIEKQLIEEFGYNPHRIQMIRNVVSSRHLSQTSNQRISSNEKSKSNSFEKSKPESLKIAVIGRCTGPKKLRTEIFLEHTSKILNALKIDHTFFVVGDQLENLETSVAFTGIEHAEINFQFLKSFDLICGSGRVAVEAGLSERPCLGFGESAFLGLLSRENLKAQLSSNFGDIGIDFSGPNFDPLFIKESLQNWLKFRGDPEFQSHLSEIRKLLETEFSEILVPARIERVYESAFFLRQYSKWIPILMYHKIPDQDLQSPHKIFVTKTNFEKHLRWFKLFGLKTLTFHDLEKFRKGLRSWKDFPRKPLVLTFDDGYLDNLVNASPLLAKYGFKAQLFLLADSSLHSNSWDHDQNNDPEHAGDQLVSGADRQKWLSSQYEIGSHGINHVHLPHIPLNEAKTEIADSKKRLESEFNQLMNVYAFTYGDTNEELARVAQNAGYSYAVNTDTGGLNLEEKPFAIFRVNIFPDETLFSLWKKTSRWYRNYYFKKRGK